MHPTWTLTREQLETSDSPAARLWRRLVVLSGPAVPRELMDTDRLADEIRATVAVGWKPAQAASHCRRQELQRIRGILKRLERAGWVDRFDTTDDGPLREPIYTARLARRVPIEPAAAPPAAGLLAFALVAAGLLGSACVVGGVGPEGLRCWALVRGEMSRTIRRPEDGAVVTERCQAGHGPQPMIAISDARPSR